MADFTANRICFKNGAEKYLLNENGVPDFNVIIPMPKSIKNTTAASDKIDCIKLYLYASNPEIKNIEIYNKKGNFFNKISKQKYNTLYNQYVEKLKEDNFKIIKMFDNNIDFDDVRLGDFATNKNFKRGKQYLTNYLKYNHYDWYSWSIANWGTKWNVIEADAVKNSDGTCEVCFDTAYTPPYTIMFALFSKAPEDIDWYEKYDYATEYTHWFMKDGSLQKMTMAEEKVAGLDKNNKNKIIKEVKEDLDVFIQLPESLRNNKEIIIAALSAYKWDDYALSSNGSFPYDWENNRDKTIFDYIDSKFKNDKDIALLMVKRDSRAITQIDKTLIKDYNFVKKCIEQNGRVLNHLPYKYRNDKELVLLGFENHSTPDLDNISLNLRNSKKVIITSINKTRYGLKYASNRLKNDYDLVKYAIYKNATAFEFASEELRNNYELCKYALERGYIDIKHILNKDILDNKELMSKAVSSGGYNLEYISDRLKEDIELIKIGAVNWNEFNTHFESNEKHQQFKEKIKDMSLEELCLYGFKHCGICWSARYFSNRLRDNAKFMYKVIKKNPSEIEFLSDRLKDDEKFILKLIKANKFYEVCYHNNNKRSKEFIMKCKEYGYNNFSFFNYDKDEIPTTIEDVKLYFSNKLVSGPNEKDLLKMELVIPAFTELQLVNANKKYNNIDEVYLELINNTKISDLSSNLFNKIPYNILTRSNILVQIINKIHNLNWSEKLNYKKIFENYIEYIKQNTEQNTVNLCYFLTEDIVQDKKLLKNVLTYFFKSHLPYLDRIIKIIKKCYTDSDDEDLIMFLLKSSISISSYKLLKNNKFFIKFLKSLDEDDIENIYDLEYKIFVILEENKNLKNDINIINILMEKGLNIYDEDIEYNHYEQIEIDEDDLNVNYIGCNSNDNTTYDDSDVTDYDYIYNEEYIENEKFDIHDYLSPKPIKNDMFEDFDEWPF